MMQVTKDGLGSERHGDEGALGKGGKSDEEKNRPKLDGDPNAHDDRSTHHGNGCG